MNDKKNEKKEQEIKSEGERKKEILEKTAKIERTVILVGIIAVVAALIYILVKFM